MKLYLFLLSVLSVTCSLNAQNSEKNTTETKKKIEVPEILTKVNLLDHVEVGAYTLTFTKVESDGRCPKQVTCVWPGEANIVIEINDGTDTEQYRISIPALGLHRKILSTDSHKVYLKNIEPYPIRTNDNLEAYKLVLKIVPQIL
jgi:hypothetical protein